jgi:hypothetical protein
MSGLLVRQHAKPNAGSAERLILTDWAVLREQPDSASPPFDLDDGNRAVVAQQELQKLDCTFSAGESRCAA